LKFKTKTTFETKELAKKELNKNIWIAEIKIN
jgi:hypothetical protein